MLINAETLKFNQSLILDAAHVMRNPKNHESLSIL